MNYRMTQLLFVGLLTMLASTGSANADGDPAKGEKIYQTKCRVCHSNEPGQHRVGPSLFGVVGRTCGQVSEKAFTRYSPGYKTACDGGKFPWTEERIDTYVEDPSKYLTGLAAKQTRSPMTVRLPDPKDRADIISYLKTLK